MTCIIDFRIKDINKIDMVTMIIHNNISEEIFKEINIMKQKLSRKKDRDL